MNARDALEIVREHRETLVAQVLNAELRIKRALARGDEVPDDAVTALTLELVTTAARVEDLSGLVDTGAADLRREGGR